MPEDKKVPRDEQPAEPQEEQTVQPPEAAPLSEAALLIGEVRQAVQAMADAVEVVSRAAMASVPLDLSVYRTITAARGVQEANELLAQGWDYISTEFCEEVQKKSGVGGSKSMIVWRPYYTLGKREPLAQTDREALAANEERRAFEAGTPVEDEGASEPAAPDMGEPVPVGSAARGRRITAASPRQTGHEGIGALADR